MAQMATPVELSGALVVLRPARPDDHRLLDRWIADACAPFWTSVPCTFYSYKQYLESLASSGLTQLASMIVDKASQAPIGLIRINSLDVGHGRAIIEAFVTEDYRSKPHGFHAFCLLVDYLMQAVNLRKVYVVTYEGFDYLGVDGRPDFFQEEARFPEHLLVGARLLEARFLALYAERWRDLRKLVWTDVQGGSSPCGAESNTHG
jgi:RimJ/RimL family protein N-acetyltransferase